jgi:hypothetical protein
MSAFHRNCWAARAQKHEPYHGEQQRQDKSRTISEYFFKRSSKNSGSEDLFQWEMGLTSAIQFPQSPTTCNNEAKKGANAPG